LNAPDSKSSLFGAKCLSVRQHQQRPIVIKRRSGPLLGLRHSVQSLLHLVTIKILRWRVSKHLDQLRHAAHVIAVAAFVRFRIGQRIIGDFLEQYRSRSKVPELLALHSFAAPQVE